MMLQSEDIFLIMFESEYQEMKKKPLNVERLMMDSVILLPPTGTPMTGIEFTKRLPCGEVSISTSRSIFRCPNTFMSVVLCFKHLQFTPSALVVAEQTKYSR